MHTVWVVLWDSVKVAAAIAAGLFVGRVLYGLESNDRAAGSDVDAFRKVAGR